MDLRGAADRPGGGPGAAGLCWSGCSRRWSGG